MAIRMIERGAEPLRGMLALMGPAGCGKTFSALRIGTGIREGLKSPKKMAMIDTEGRGHLYEGRFDFDRYEMPPPYNPEEWIKAFAELDDKYSVIISDSFSDEHEGIGGLCEMAANSTNPNDVGKWAKPKAEHKQLMNRIRRLKAQHVFLLRASEKLRIVKGQKDPEYLGWQPHCEKNFLFDVVLAWMLAPNCAGHADLYKSIDGFNFQSGVQLSEEHGRAIAGWIKGAPVAAKQEVEMGSIVRILGEDGVPYHTGSTWRLAVEAWAELKKVAGEDAARLRRLRTLNKDALMLLQEYAPPKVRERLQAEIEAAE